MSAFSLLGRLFGAQVEQVGDNLVGALVAFDPETATEVDRDVLVEKIQKVAEKLAIAKQDFTKEQRDVEVKQKQIQEYLVTLEIMVAQVERQQITQAVFDEFYHGVEEAQVELTQEITEANDAKAVKEELEEILKILTQQMNEFDRLTQKAIRDMKLAETQKENEKLKAERQAELSRLKKGLGAESTAVKKLQEMATKAKVEAEAVKTVREITQKPQSQAEKMAAIVAQTKQASTPTLSAAEKLAILKAKSQIQ
ncbi:MAG: hypothetical protein RL637_295 [Pseudomonadota bacterium]|jgi:hypothetical protein